MNTSDPLAEFWNAFYRESKNLAIRAITGEYKLAVDLEKNAPSNSGLIRMGLGEIHDIYAPGLRFLQAKWN